MQPPTPKQLEKLARQTAYQRLCGSYNQQILAGIEEQLDQMWELWNTLGVAYPNWGLIHLDLLMATQHDPRMATQYDTRGKYPDPGLSPSYWPRLPEYIHASRDALYCQLQMRQHNNPLWVLDPECAEALINTDPPLLQDIIDEQILDERLRLPYPGLFLSVPPLFDLLDPVTGMHPIEGIYLAETPVLPLEGAKWVQGDRTRTWAKAIHRFGTKRMLLICAVGKTKGLHRGPDDVLDINDTLRTINIGPGVSIDKILENGPEDGRLITNLVLNLLMALNTKHLTTRTVAAKKPPKNPSKRDKAERRGALFNSHTIVSLAPRAKQSTGTRTASTQHTSPRGHSVRAHWHSYWVVDPGDETPLGTREREDGKTLHRVWRWVNTFKRGTGDTTPRYKVR